MTAATNEIQPQKLEALLGTMVSELGAAANAVLIILGHKLGLFRALANGGACKLGRACETHRHARALCARVAQRTGGEWVRDV